MMKTDYGDSTIFQSDLFLPISFLPVWIIMGRSIHIDNDIVFVIEIGAMAA
jgi:hypothetical protein